MALIESWFNQDLQEPVKVRYLDGNVFSADNAGNLIGVNVFDNGSPASLAGSVAANVIRSDGATVPVSGALSGNKATVVLNQSCYAVPGPISIIVKITASGATTTICAVVANVYQATTDTVIDPGTIIPSIETLIAAIDAAVASIPADYSSLWACLAPAFSSSQTYSADDYVTYDGGLYRFINSHSGTWDSADVVATNIGRALTDIRYVLDGLYADKVNLFRADLASYGWCYTISNQVVSKVTNASFGQSAPIPVSGGERICIYSVTPNTDGFYIVRLGSNDIDDVYGRGFVVSNPTSYKGGSLYVYTVPEGTNYITVNFLAARADRVFIFADDRSKTETNSERFRYLGNPQEELFFPATAYRGWYYTSNGGTPEKVIADWAGQSDLIKVSSGDVITIYGTGTSDSDGINILTTSQRDFDHIQRIKGHPAFKVINGKSVIEYAIPNNAEYISFSFGLNRIDYISVFRNAKLYDSKLSEVAAIGDSITYGHITSSIRANPTWCESVAANLHCAVYNHGLSGSGICNGSVTPLTTILDNMTEAWLDCLVIAAGTNDYGDERAHSIGSINDTPAQGTNFYASFKYLIEQAVNKYPMAQILVITPMRRRYSSANQYGIALEDIVNAEIEVARYYGVKCFDFYHEGGINPANDWQRVTYTQDGLHPNQKGIDLFLAPRFSKAIEELISCRSY